MSLTGSKLLGSIHVKAKTLDLSCVVTQVERSSMPSFGM
jgi:hypothetical protein